MKVCTSPYQNPFLNLALEDYFLRGGADLPILFFYVNRPSVVMGRFQNPWRECHLPYLVDKDIWLVRRQSGGGCVFHDEGNLNFSFITPDAMINRQKHAEVLKEAFGKAGIDLQISPRNDLWLQDNNQEWKKISGSAYKQTKFGSFHHGTFLVSSDLNKLEESLKHTVIPKTTKSIASVRSRVISLHERFPGVEIPDVIELVSHHLKTTPFEIDEGLLSRVEVQQSFQHLRSWEWLWGETPGFDLETKKGDLNIHKGRISGSETLFSKESMNDYFDETQLEILFPDFSEQHRSSNLIL